MQVVLLENLKNVGKIGDVIKVKRGYARNFLIKFNKALIASKINILEVNKKKELLNSKDLEFKKIAKGIFEKLNKNKFVVEKLLTENNELYGSVKPTEISKLILNKENIEIKPSQIDLVKEIKTIGDFVVKLNLHSEVQASIIIQVNKTEEQK